MRKSVVGLVLVLASLVAAPNLAAAQNASSALAAFRNAANASGTEEERIHALLMTMTHQNQPEKPQPAGPAVRNNSCEWANDGECDEPGIGTGACASGTDYNDCWRIAQGVEDDSCRWANDGECDEPHLGTGSCAQATDVSDCGSLITLRFQNDSCIHAFDGVCNVPGVGDGTCEPRTDRSDCIGRERPMGIMDHFFGHDDRRLMDTAVMPWAVVGTLTDNDGGSCTATLIGADVLVTAAHCIEVEEGGVDVSQQFTTGFGLPGGPRSARVIGYMLSPNRAADLASKNEDTEGTDWALLRIDRPLGTELGYLEVRPPVATWSAQELLGSIRLLQAGYSWDTGVNLSGNVGCRIVSVFDDNTFAHDCDTTKGDSGSPFMVEENGAWYVVATDSAFRFAEPGAPALYVASRADAWFGFLPGFASGELGTMVGGSKPKV
ncbi:MAG: trypsin-like serine protease [Bauldia sp.]|nr:trypsin-like serine protease [Bauldia sp.]